MCIIDILFYIYKLECYSKRKIIKKKKKTSRKAVKIKQ